MEWHKPLLYKLAQAIPIIIGVTLVSFTLMVYFGPDLSYELAGKNPTEADLKAIQRELGYDQPFLWRYALFLWELIRFDFGISNYWNKSVNSLLASSIPVSILLMLPGFLLGHVFAVALAVLAARNRGSWVDKTVMAYSVFGMSISFLVVMIGFQIFLASSSGLNLFPVRGWNVYDINGYFSFSAYINHVTVPTLILIFVSIGYNTRFYRAVLVEEMQKNHVITAQAFGYKKNRVWFLYIFKNCMISIITRLLFSIPLLIVGGSLLLESFFGIPGIGLITYEAISAGDQPVLKAVVSLTAILFVLILTLSELFYRWFDPRFKEP
ncbi:ABC transporter permease [Marinicella sp. W31]|uniref:ABC transporter permease n=1 Tax=Marinicella sp. W31 TaxID=3023713 RepID=UPI0037583A82